MILAGNENSMTRRQAMQAGAVLAAAAVGGSSRPLESLARENSADEKLKFIDCHSHIWTPDTEKYPLNKGVTKQDLDPPSFTTEELLKLATANGVGRVVLIQHNVFYGWDNSYMIDAVRAHPGVFSIVGMVDDRAPHPEAAMRRLLKNHVRGFRITPRIYGREKWLDGPGMAAMWKCAAETGQAMCCLIDAEDLAAVDRMCGRFPETPVVIDHFARVGVDGHIRDEDVDRLCAMAKHPRVALKVSAFYALGKKQPPYDDLVPMIRRAFEAFGAKRLMWGSDSPYQLVGDKNTYEASLRLVRDGLDFLADDDRKQLLGKTAERVFFA